jgi:aldose 1-epimerase
VNGTVGLSSPAAVSKSIAGTLPDGREVAEIRLTNRLGSHASILDLGATLRACVVADARGRFDDIVLGFDSAAEYLQGGDYFGATVGRYANRIAGGRFSIGGESYQLELNSGPHAEHGGAEGFHRKIWRVEETDASNGAAVRLSLLSPDGDQGYPGELSVNLKYTLTNHDELWVEYRATTAAATVLNLTNHTYWSLAAGADALEALLCVQADGYTPVDESLIPTGEIRPVAGTAFDFRTPQIISARIRDGSEVQLQFGRGYDHNFVLRGEAGRLRMAARLEEPRSGRVLEMLTTEPGLQVYTGNCLSGAVLGKGGRLYRQGDGIALESQHFPDSPNHPQFPSTILEPGRVWSSTTVYRFRGASCP